MKLIFFVVILSTFCIQAAEMTLVRDGKPEAVILLNAGKNTRSAQMGALELQHHIKKATGATLPIVTEPQKGKISIRIGGGDVSGLQGDAHRIRTGKDFILLTGSDTQDFGQVDYSKASTFPLALHFRNGSLFAVYDFLETYCGVRFFRFEDKYTVVQQCKTLTVDVKDKDFESPMDGFRWIYPEGNRAKALSGRDYELNKLRWRMCLQYGRTNHNQYSIYFKHWGRAKSPKLAPAFTEKRPELFAKGKGTVCGVDNILRVNYPDDSDIPSHLCYSNQDTVRYYANEVLTYAKGGNVLGGWGNQFGNYPVTKTVLPRIPGKPFFYPIEGGDTGGHCLCATCQKRFPKDSSDDISNNKFQFISDVAREVAKTDPTAGVSTLAYIQTLGYPDSVTFPENVSVQLCLPFYSWWHPIACQKQFSAYKEWIRKEGKRLRLTLWSYIYSSNHDARVHYGGLIPFPTYYPWKVGELVKMFGQDGLRGHFAELDTDSCALEGYIAAKLSYDPSLVPEEIINDYFCYAFGMAAPYAKEFYKEIETAAWNPPIPKELLKDPDILRTPLGTKHPYWSTGLWYPELNWALATPERMKKCADLITAIGKHVKTESEKLYYEELLRAWKKVEKGKIDYERMQILKKVPMRTMAVNESADLEGDFNKIDWKSVPVTEKWTLLSGQPSDSLCEVRSAADSKYLYLEFRDPKGADPKHHTQDDFEIFMPVNNGYPLYQLCISPKGKIHQLLHTMKNGKREWKTYDFQLKSDNRIEADGTWRVCLAIPRNRLPFKDNVLKINFFRTEKSKIFKSWNPIFSGRYLEGLDRAGSIMIFPKVIQENFFYCHDKRESGSKFADPAADNGKTAWVNWGKGWFLRYNSKETFPVGKYNLSIRVRAEMQTPQDNHQFNVGIIDMKTKKNIISRIIKINECKGKEFKEIRLGLCEFGPGKSFYVAGFNDKEAKGTVYIDSLKFSLPEQK